MKDMDDVNSHSDADTFASDWIFSYPPQVSWKEDHTFQNLVPFHQGPCKAVFLTLDDSILCVGFEGQCFYPQPYLPDSPKKEGLEVAG